MVRCFCLFTRSGSTASVITCMCCAPSRGPPSLFWFQGLRKKPSHIWPQKAVTVFLLSWIGWVRNEDRGAEEPFSAPPGLGGDPYPSVQCLGCNWTLCSKLLAVVSPRGPGISDTVCSGNLPEDASRE